MTELMAGKKGLVMGVANKKSMAWKIAQTLDEAGAELAFTYKDEQVGQKVVPLFEEIGADFYETLDVTDDDDFEEVFTKLEEEFDGQLDFIVHSIAGGPEKEDLRGKYMNTSRESFSRALEISVYSYVKAVQMAYPMLKESDGAAAITLSYYGAEKVVPNYNVMGVAKAALESSVYYLADDLGSDNIRVNALSPGPVLTRAASGIGDFRNLLREFKDKAPLERLVDQDEVANSALYLLSDLSSGVTGEIIHVDCGFNIEA
ncbi:enoyl-ACP reductase FabI [Halanaerobacter jeridensis]|uniref:Enoyl-[acyl-carrier-protein] reductase [NADH] n=1 Tax=Halanaerobacter jeridensis TaxID=706427 RepID=A0A938XQ60_9FIRM|nr:enoyl-ACP reductase [Halanaerobacter jeridensis]MBM7557773.1 enoyl-[acyl-carrier protein] reductase I [Halanaerobacter jeridensis]